MPSRLILGGFALALCFALFALPAAAAGMCRPGDVSINCGSGPQCAKAPAVCCAGKTCGGGMVCAQTARGPECGVARVTRCGKYTCGEGMACVQTPRGPECGSAGGGARGRAAGTGGQGKLAGGGGDKFLQMCPSFKTVVKWNTPSACACVHRLYKQAGMTSEEFEAATLMGLDKQDEAMAIIGRWSEQQLDASWRRLDTDTKSCGR